MKKIIIKRFSQDENQTLGNCTIFNKYNIPIFSSFSLERGWKDNNRNISCVPLGNYDVVLEWSPRFRKNLWELKGVPERSECKFHAANYWFQLHGCISLGLRLSDINNDGYRDVTNSRIAMKAFHKALRDETKCLLIIENEKNL